MTMPPEHVSVKCPACGEVYDDWYRASYNAGLGEEWDEEYLDKSSSATCPSCGHKVYFGQLRVSEDGRTWTFYGKPDEK